MKKTPKRETSPRFAEKPREVVARTPAPVLAPASERDPTPWFDPKQIKRFAAGSKTYTWRKRGGAMIGERGTSPARIASHLGTVPQAFFR